MRFIVFLFLILTPVLSFTITTHAQSSPPVAPITDDQATQNQTDRGFIPCSGVTCSACDLVALANTLIDWLIGILFVLFAILFAVAGVRLVTSGGNQSALQGAKSSLTNAVIGLIIVLAAWVLVDTIMRVLVGNGGQFSNNTPWSEIECWSQTDVDFNQYAIPNIQSSAGGGAGAGAPALNRGLGGACNPLLLGRYFPTETAAAQCIIRDESSCGANLDSRTDIMRANNMPFSFGPMQINITVHSLQGCGPNGSTLNCPAAFNGRNYSATIRNQALYDQCARAARQPACNLSNGRIIRNNRGSWDDWSTAAGCGL